MMEDDCQRGVDESSNNSDDYKGLFCIRTITCFLVLTEEDISNETNLRYKIKDACELLQRVEQLCLKNGYQVQTIRIATNPFGEWLLPSSSNNDTISSIVEERLKVWKRVVMEEHGIQFCSLGPAKTSMEMIQYCPMIVRSGCSCSAIVNANDVIAARSCASIIQQLSWEDNFRFCTTSNCPPHIPFFPAAKAASSSSDTTTTTMSFGIGLENGSLLHHFLSNRMSIADIPTVLKEQLIRALSPIDTMCKQQFTNHEYLGIDTSWNPSLSDDDDGSVAHAMEQLQEIHTFGSSGTLASAAALTNVIQSLSPNIIRTTGYCGLMLPVCEDVRLAELGTYDNNKLSILHLLQISSVCGVGVDTVPLAGNVSQQALTSLILDVAALANRWNKPLSCRVFPVANANVGDSTQFDDSPYLCNTKIFDLP